MPRYHRQNGENVQFTEEEEKARDAEELLWEQNKIVREVTREIRRLEHTVTPRRMREAALTDAGKQWLAEIENQISLERVKLKEQNDGN